MAKERNGAVSKFLSRSRLSRENLSRSRSSRRLLSHETQKAPGQIGTRGRTANRWCRTQNSYKSNQIRNAILQSFTSYGKNGTKRPVESTLFLKHLAEAKFNPKISPAGLSRRESQRAYSLQA